MTLVDVLRTIDTWPGARHSAAVVADGVLVASHRPMAERYALASVTKPLVAYATLVAVEEGSVGLDEPLELGTSLRHLLAHTSGLAPDERTVIAPPATRRIYSNAGFELIGDLIAAATGMRMATYLEEAVLAPLAMVDTSLDGSPASGASSTIADLAASSEWSCSARRCSRRRPSARRRRCSSPGSMESCPASGVRPRTIGVSGFELRGTKHPHWTAASASPRTFGHFGRSGTFIWIDPDVRVGCVYLGDADFGPWAIDAWPAFNAAVLEAVAG